MLGDVIPILLFVLLYIGFGFRRLAGYGVMPLLGVYGVFFAMASQLGGVPEEWAFNGSIAYAPCLMVLMALAVASRKKYPAVAKGLWGSAALFFVSLAFRSGDMAWCVGLPVGTHFLWHCLNGV
jgi:hypothetical protein